MHNFALLLPPTEGKLPGGNPFAPDMFDYRSAGTFNFFIELNRERRVLIDALQEAVRSGEGLEAIFGVNGALLEEAVLATTELYRAPLMSALDRYSLGVMYKSMDFAGLPTGAQRRLLENGIIFSGLFGLLRPDDLVPNYRLSMDAVIPGVGKVSSYWRQVLSPVLNTTLEGRTVWNLLPGIHQEAWDDQHSYRQMVFVNFFEERDGERKPLLQGARPLRGQLVNFVARESVEEVEQLRNWENPEGYRFDDAALEVDEAARTVTVSMVKAEE